MRIQDDGRGFDPTKVRRGPRNGWGLANMRERASFLNGTVTVDSSLHKGTEVVLSIPLS